MWIQSSSWFKFLGSFLHALTFYRDRPLHTKEDHATSMVNISFEDTHPVPYIIIIVITVSLGVNISALSTTTLKGDYPSQAGKIIMITGIKPLNCFVIFLSGVPSPV